MEMPGIDFLFWSFQQFYNLYYPYSLYLVIAGLVTILFNAHIFHLLYKALVRYANGG